MTDVNDATWLADLLAHGLIRPSFVPPADVQALRDLTRTRKQFIRERSGHVQRIDKLLQGANLKLGSVLSDIMGQGGRAVLDAGESDPERLADQVRTKVRAFRAELVEALRGRLGAHQRVVLRLHLAQADAIEAAVAELDREVGDRLAPFCDLVARLSTMPGLSSVSASAILSEIGSDMSRFPTPAHLVSTSSPGRGCARGTTRAPAGAARRGYGMARRGSRRSWCKRPGRRSGRRPALTAARSTACGRGAGPRRRSGRWPRPCSPLSTSFSPRVSPIAISGPITSSAPTRSAWPPAS